MDLLVSFDLLFYSDPSNSTTIMLDYYIAATSDWWTCDPIYWSSSSWLHLPLQSHPSPEDSYPSSDSHSSISFDWECQLTHYSMSSIYQCWFHPSFPVSWCSLDSSIPDHSIWPSCSDWFFESGIYCVDSPLPDYLTPISPFPLFPIPMSISSLNTYSFCSIPEIVLLPSIDLHCSQSQCWMELYGWLSLFLSTESGILHSLQSILLNILVLVMIDESLPLHKAIQWST